MKFWRLMRKRQKITPYLLKNLSLKRQLTIVTLPKKFILLFWGG